MSPPQRARRGSRLILNSIMIYSYWRWYNSVAVLRSSFGVAILSAIGYE